MSVSHFPNILLRVVKKSEGQDLSVRLFPLKSLCIPAFLRNKMTFASYEHRATVLLAR